MMAGPTISTRRSGAVRLVHLSIGIGMLAGGSIGYSDQGWAKHHKSKSQTASPTPADPCSALNAFIEKHIAEMKKLKAEIEAEKTAVPNSLEAAFERLQGKVFVDAEKNDKLAETRREANAVNSLLRAQGCTPVDIDGALANP
jgi:predicted negative regulator of RcsB-dependent stress response